MSGFPTLGSAPITRESCFAADYDVYEDSRTVIDRTSMAGTL